MSILYLSKLLDKLWLWLYAIQLVTAETSLTPIPTQGEYKQHAIPQESLHISLTYLWFSEQVTFPLAWTAAANLTLFQKHGFEDKFCTTRCQFSQCLWSFMLTHSEAFAWVTWIIYPGFSLGVTCKYLMPKGLCSALFIPQTPPYHHHPQMHPQSMTIAIGIVPGKLLEALFLCFIFLKCLTWKIQCTIL